MIRHHHISDKKKPVLFAHPPEFLHEQISRPHCSEQRQSPITTERQKVELALTVVTLQSLRHSTPKPPPSKTEGGAPPSYYSTVNYKSGMLSAYGAIKKKTQAHGRATRQLSAELAY